MELIKTKQVKPPRILLHGEGGTGKSSLAASVPGIVFINTEDGLSEIDATSLPLCKTFDDVMAQLEWVYLNATEKEMKAVAVDSIDWTETLIYKDICKEKGVESIDDIGFGGAYKISFEKFRRFQAALQHLRDDKKLAIFLIAHTDVVTYQNPLGENYDRYQIKLRDKHSALFREWADLVGLMRAKAFVKVEKEGMKETKKAVGNNQILLSCYRNPAFVAKNRYGILDDIEISEENGWNDLYTAMKKNQ